MDKEVDMLCRLIEESQKEASTLLSYAGAVSKGNGGSAKKWSPAYVAGQSTTSVTTTKTTNNPWGPPLPPSIGYSSSGGLWRPSSTPGVISMDVKSFLSPIV